MSNINYEHLKPKNNEHDPSIWNSSVNSYRNSELELVFFGYEECAPNKSWGPGTKGLYKIHYVHCGKGKLFVNNKELPVQEGECFVLYPDTYLYYEADAITPWHYSWIAFDGTNAEYYLKRANIGKEDIVVKTFDRLTLEDAFQKLMKINLSDVTKDLKFISLLYTILSTFIPPEEKNSEKDYVSSEHIKSALKYIHEHYTENISITDIAAHLSLERKYFSRIFKEQLRMPPSVYLSNYRLSQACEMLETTNLSISEISQKIGYDNPFSFSRAFKKNYNLSPATYRSQAQNQLSSNTTS